MEGYSGRIRPWFGGLVFAVLLGLLTAWPGQAGAVPVVMVNDTVLVSDPAPVIEDGIWLVPAKELATALGGSFSFDPVTNQGIFRCGGQEICFLLNSPMVTVNGKVVRALWPMVREKNRLLVPAGLLTETLRLVTRVKGETLAIYVPVGGQIKYKVEPGDFLWLLAQKFGTTVAEIKKINALNTDLLLVGQLLVIRPQLPPGIRVTGVTARNTNCRAGAFISAEWLGTVPAGTTLPVTGKTGDWYRVRSAFGDGYVFSSLLHINQENSPEPAPPDVFAARLPVDTMRDQVSYVTYRVVAGDTLWSVSEKWGILYTEVAAVNGLSSNANLRIGQELSLPVHKVAVQPVTGSGYGEVLDWEKQAQYLLPIGQTGELTDLATGRSFRIARTMGASHADVETLTPNDTAIMKSIFGGSWNWGKRPFLLTVAGRRIAVSVAGMPHAGIDQSPFLAVIAERTGNYGFGPNYDKIKGNGMDGHFDLYTLNSSSHATGQIDRTHQVNVLLAGGLR